MRKNAKPEGEKRRKQYGQLRKRNCRLEVNRLRQRRDQGIDRKRGRKNKK